MAFLANNIGTILISAILLAIVIAIIASLIRKKKKGECLGCDCASCGGGCPMSEGSKNP